MARARRRGAAEDLPTGRRLPVRSPAPARTDAAARAVLDGAGEGDGGARAGSEGGDPRLLDAAAVGDRIVCRRNDARLGIRNGLRATIAAIDEDTVTLRTDSGALRTVDVRYAAEQFEHGYALTGHAAQGATVERAFVLLHDRGGLREWGYVACTRAREETRLYLADDAPERQAHGHRPAHPAALERAIRALTTSASEPLALEQGRASNDSTSRMLTTRRQQLEQARARAAHRLAEAETKLDQLGWRGRRKHSAELRTEIAMQHAALRLADEKLAEPLPTPTSPSAPASPNRTALERDHARQLRRVRENWASARDLEREYGLHMDL